MLPVETPFKIYTGLDGKPLNNGYVYFGQPDENPVTDPVTVYWDAAGTLPALQPLRTVNGYIMRTGTPANVFCDSVYSELVNDSKGRQVFYAPTSADFDVGFALDGALKAMQLADYVALRGYAGPQKSAYVTGYLVTAAPSGITGTFVRDDSDNTSVDNGGTIIVAANGKRWKRVFKGSLQVDWFGADPSGVTQSHTAINAACAAVVDFAETVEFSRGNYKLGGPIKTTIAGMVLKGASQQGTYFTTEAGSVFDMLRVASAYVRVSDILFRPGGNQYCMRLYAAHCTIENNRFLAATDNVGTAILIADADPDTATFVPGAYTHTINNNVIGVSDFAFSIGIEDGTTTGGVQACKITTNQILSDRPIKITKGGGNTYFGNLLQSSGAGTGNGIDLGANVNGEKIGGNYFEGFAVGVLLRNLSNANQVAHIVGNHFDACTAKVTSLGTTNYVFENDAGSMYSNGWVDDYTSTAVRRWKTPGGTDALAISSAGYLLVNTTSGANHVINTTTAPQNTVLLAINGAGSNTAYFQHATGTAPNGANTGFAVKANSITLRGISSGGTINASGADGAEYMHKAPGCGDIAKGQLAGVNVARQLVDKWSEAISFVVKSTNPSLVGNDVWHAPRPAPPSDEADEATHRTYAAELASWEVAHEEARRGVDRISFFGQVPVNVYGATPGDFIIPEQDGDGIKGVPVAAPTFEQYMRAVGKVIGIEPDGRAWIIVKVA